MEFTVQERNTIRDRIAENQAPLLWALEHRVTGKIAALEKKIAELE